ncbi:MAG TPA: excinuclease ABC subunit UvrC [Fimbriimonadaceae bacterium]|nr:excinuclease ABC subunit UvrC [Fimbriimonadaceae bacterium]
MPRLNTSEAVAEKLKGLPTKPGCYLYRDGDGDVLYVGKAVSLRQRVRSYFQESTRHSARIARMVHRVRDLEWIVVDSELEALVLECNLIKQHRPPYNVRLRDDKSYPYITITNEKYPRLLFTRKVRKDGAKYFGPYTSAWAVRDTIQLLHKVFPLIPCGKLWSGREEQRPCLYHHLGQCLAPCAGLSDAKAYKEIVHRVERFLAGKQEGIVEEIRSEMEHAAEHLEFEKAAALRDRLQSVEAILQRQKVLTTDAEDRDVIAVVKDERGAAIQMLYVRNGKLIGQRQFVLDGAAESAPSEAVQEFVKQYYADAPEIPREVILPVEIAERAIVQQWLRSRRGSSVTVEVPQGGEKLRLVDLAASNAEQALELLRLEMEQKESWTEQATEQLAEALDLVAPPVRIEGYDISNIQGRAPVGSMVVTESGEPSKAEYRRFKIRYHPEDPNDFAMMHEVITRRLKAYLDGDEKFAKLPDLIMIDGGKGQLHAALKARDDLGLTVPMVGLAKKMELLFRPIDLPREPGKPKEYGFEPIELPLQSPGLLLLRRLRDEAHRFALTYHRKVRDKRFQGSALEEVPGVGPRRRRLLLRTFGSLEGIRRASVEELAAVPTMTRRLAEQVREYLAET